MTRKTDRSKHGICIAAIKRSTFKPYDYKWTQFYESNSDFPYSGLEFRLEEKELIICSTVIDPENYSILTTQKLITKENGLEKIGELRNSQDKSYGSFKSLKENFTFGNIILEDGTMFKYFIETGKASMIMIHGVRTILRTQKMTAQNIANVTRVWNKKNNISGE